MWGRVASRLLAAAAAKGPGWRLPRCAGGGATRRRGGAALASVAAAAAVGPLGLRPLRLEEQAPERPPPTPKPSGAPGPRRTGSVNVDQENLHLRRVFVTGDINDDSAKAIVQQLLYLEAEDPDAPITMFINSGGGLVHSGLAILDVMSHLSPPVRTVAYGRCFSIAALLLAAGAPGQRMAYSNARLMIHEPSCSYPKLQCSDIMIKADELRHTQRTLEAILSARTGRPQAEIAGAVQRDRYMSVAEAQEFGIIDGVVTATPSATPARARSSVREVPNAAASAPSPPAPVPPAPVPPAPMPTTTTKQRPTTPEGGPVKELG